MAPAINFINVDFKDTNSDLIDNSSKCFAEFNTINYKEEFKYGY